MPDSDWRQLPDPPTIRFPVSAGLAWRRTIRFTLDLAELEYREYRGVLSSDFVVTGTLDQYDTFRRTVVARLPGAAAIFVPTADLARPLWPPVKDEGKIPPCRCPSTPPKTGDNDS